MQTLRLNQNKSIELTSWYEFYCFKGKIPFPNIFSNIQGRQNKIHTKTNSPIFFQKSSIFSGIFNDLIVLLAKSVSDNPFKVLWAAKKSNKLQVFSKYYLPCHKKLTMYCLGVLKDLELAENAATDALLKLFQSKQEEFIENPEAWLFTVARNKCLTLLSQKKRRREILDGLKPSIPKIALAKGDQQLEAEDLKKRIKALLNEKEWGIWTLHQQGYSNKEIAKKLDATEKTIANLKSMTRNKLRAALRPQKK